MIGIKKIMAAIGDVFVFVTLLFLVFFYLGSL